MLSARNVKKKIVHHFYLYLLQYCTSILYKLYFFLCNISNTLKLFLLEYQFFKNLTLKFCFVKYPALTRKILQVCECIWSWPYLSPKHRNTFVIIKALKNSLWLCEIFITTNPNLSKFFAFNFAPQEAHLFVVIAVKKEYDAEILMEMTSFLRCLKQWKENMR